MENKFINGLFTSKRDGSPDFVLANLSFKTEMFIEWLKENTNENGYVNVDVLKSKEGKLYSKLNDWKPTTLPNTDITGAGIDKRVLSGETDNTISVDSIPF